MYACRGNTFLEEDSNSKQANIPSPDGKKRIIMTKPKVFVIFDRGRPLRTLYYSAINASIEAGWSPDSTQLFIAYSASGAIGDFHVHMFHIRGGKVIQSGVPALVAADFRKEHYCTTRGNNLLFLGWTADSKQALLVPEVYPTSDCEQLGLFRGYLVDTQREIILKRFGEKQTEEIKHACYANGVINVK